MLSKKIFICLETFNPQSNSKKEDLNCLEKGSVSKINLEFKDEGIRVARGIISIYLTDEEVKKYGQIEEFIDNRSW